MAKRKYPSELNTKLVRINLGQYAMLTEISRRAGVTMSEALQLALERQEQVTRVSPAQIPMLGTMLGTKVDPPQVRDVVVERVLWQANP